MKKKLFLAKKTSITWISVSFLLISLLIVVSILTGTVFYDIICIAIGGERPVFASGIEPVYEAETESKEDALKNAMAVNLEVCEEGMVLLKNKNEALPVKTSVSDSSVKVAPKISVFGKNSVNLAYGGSGSGGASSAGAVDLYSALSAAGYDVNPVLKNFYSDNRASGNGRQANSDDLDSGKVQLVKTGETPVSRYTDNVKGSFADYSDVAVIVLTRIGGEGFDLPRTMKGVEGANSESDHYLMLDKNEREMVQLVTSSGFDKVVVLLNAANAMELRELEENDNIDAILSMGFPGINGVQAVGSILNGTVNPSGRTVDTYATDFKQDPTWNNFGVPVDENGELGSDLHTYFGDATDFHYVNYEEGIYVGYRYYETRGAADEDWYNKAVVYPFGYGLSYADFTWQADFSAVDGQTISKTGKYEINVTVTNNGSVAGKDVVQLYGHAPYTAGGIEKAEVVLLDFAKTPLIEPHTSETVTLTFDPYYLASYDYADKKGGGYILEGSSDYRLYVSKNSHDRSLETNFSVASDMHYGRDPVTNYEVKDHYSDQDDETLNSDINLSTVLSRGNWDATWPTAPDAEEREISNAEREAIYSKDHNNPYADDYEMEDPLFGQDGEVRLRDLLSNEESGEFMGIADYDDSRWGELVSRCTVEELVNLTSYGAFKSAGILSIGKPLTNDTDGPAGFVNFMDQVGSFYGTCAYCNETVMAGTWNIELIEELGRAVGEEGIWGADDKGNFLPYSGWYSPGANIHRSPFGGRNFEYFSEDGLLSGKMAAAEIRGCRSKGVYCFIKHFALNEQETYRAAYGNCSYATEQSIREIYLRPFELAVKDGKVTGVMSSFNRIGTKWTGGDYRLLTEILRNEWGFKGTVITDFNTHPEYMDLRQMAYAGGDLNLQAYNAQKWVETSSGADLTILKNCAKNIFYTVANSNAMNNDIVGYKMPLWQTLLIVLDCVVFACCAAWGTILIVRHLKYKKADTAH